MARIVTDLLIRIKHFPQSRIANIVERLDRPALRIGHWIAEHVEEDGLCEFVELCEGGAAFGPQHLRDPLLLRQRATR